VRQKTAGSGGQRIAADDARPSANGARQPIDDGPGVGRVGDRARRPCCCGQVAAEPIGDEGARALAEALPRAALKYLYLTNNSIGDAGARALAEALPRAPALEGLFLFDNSIGDEAKAALRTAWGARGGSLGI